MICNCALPYYHPGCCAQCSNYRTYFGTNTIGSYTYQEPVDYEKLAEMIARKILDAPVTPTKEGEA